MKSIKIKHEGMHRLALVIAAASFVILPSIIYMNTFDRSFWRYWEDMFAIYEKFELFKRDFSDEPFIISFYLLLPFISFFIGYCSLKILEWVKEGFD